MTALTITPTQRKSLKAEAHGLNPVVMIGGDGLSPAVIKEAKSAINHHGLIKIRVLGDDREARIAIYEELCDKLDAAPVQHIGKLLVLWKPKDVVEEAYANLNRSRKQTKKVFQDVRGRNQKTSSSRSGSGKKSPFERAAAVKKSSPKNEYCDQRLRSQKLAGHLQAIVRQAPLQHPLKNVRYA